jgi:MoaA/NifB/PqqE/SkfB family radical SAM enzyme
MNFFPKKVNFDICTYCNHKCTFCSNADTRTLKDTVSYLDFITVMDNVTKYVDVDELGLSAKGEVLLNNDIINIVRVAKERYGIKYVYISSNGAFLTKKLAKKLLQAGLDSIKFSINGYDAESYRIVHLKDDFLKVIKNFNDLLELKSTEFPNTKIFISSIIDINKVELEKYFQKYFSKHYDLISGVLKYNITYTPKFNDFKVDKSKLKACPLVFNEIYIDSDCRLGLCCKDYFKEFDYGSLLKYDFKTLYQGDNMSSIRKLHTDMALPEDHFCKKCLIFEVNNA